MKVMITNDDGPVSQGLELAIKVFEDNFPFEIFIPNKRVNAKSMSYTAYKLKKITNQNVYGHNAHLVNGTPVDCTMVGLKRINPSFIFSGINLGENLATDIYYSGTVGAAISSIIQGIPAIAASIELENYSKSLTGLEVVKGKNYESVVVFLKKIMNVVKMGLPKDIQMLNINFPSDADETTDFEITKIGKRSYDFDDIKIEIDKTTSGFTFRTIGYPEDDISTDGFDNYVVKRLRKISITPLKFDRYLSDEVSKDSIEKLNDMVNSS